MTILVADDDPAIRRLLRRILERLGYDCVTTVGAAGLQARCTRRRPGAVISDVGLGEGDGIDACLELRRRYPRLAMIIMTGDPIEARRARSAGFLEVLDKPFTVEEFAAALRRALSRRPGHGTP